MMDRLTPLLPDQDLALMCAFCSRMDLRGLAIVDANGCLLRGLQPLDQQSLSSQRGSWTGVHWNEQTFVMLTPGRGARRAGAMAQNVRGIQYLGRPE